MSKKIMSKKIVLSSYYGGLGDNLAYSTLPEEFFKQKNIKVYCSKLANFRNKEIYKLLWKDNPYVFGNSKKKNTMDITSNGFDKKFNIIQNYEKSHGLKVKNKYPKIYYRPKKKNLKKIFLVDISSVSLFYSEEENQKIFKTIIKLKKKYRNCKFLNVVFKKKLIKPKTLNFYHKVKFFIKNKFIFGKIKPNSRGNYSYLNRHFSYPQKLDGEIKINSIYNYCDILSSCAGFVSTHHGQSHLSSAIKNQYNRNLQSFTIMQKKWYNDHQNRGLFIFDNIKYILI